MCIRDRCPSKLVPLLKKRYPFLIGIDRNPTNFEYDEIICDGVAAAEKAVEYLISLGHRDIAYIGNCSFESRYIGYYQSLLNHKIPLDYDNICLLYTSSLISFLPSTTGIDSIPSKF